MTDQAKRVILGNFGAPYGVKGWVKINSATEPAEAIVDYQPWQIETKSGYQTLEVVESRRHQKIVVAHIKGFDDRDVVKTLTGIQITVPREELPTPEDDAIYWIDLEGMEVINLDGINLGRVDRLFSTTSNDVMIVKGEKKRLIPFIRETFITNVDMKEKRITVDWDPTF